MSPRRESIMKFVDDIEGSVGLAEEDEDFLKSLEKMAEEIEGQGEG